MTSANENKMTFFNTVHKMEQDIHIHSLYGVKISATLLFIINRVSPKMKPKKALKK